MILSYEVENVLFIFLNAFEVFLFYGSLFITI